MLIEALLIGAQTCEQTWHLLAGECINCGSSLYPYIRQCDTVLFSKTTNEPLSHKHREETQMHSSK